MSQCLHIIFFLDSPQDFLSAVLQPQAKKLGIEGVAHRMDQDGTCQVKITACGSPEKLDEFLDAIHHGVSEDILSKLEIVPVLKEKDYRGVFRIIE